MRCGMGCGYIPVRFRSLTRRDLFKPSVKIDPFVQDILHRRVVCRVCAHG